MSNSKKCAICDDHFTIQLKKAKEYVAAGGKIEAIQSKYKMTDEQRYEDNLIFNTKYIIRDKLSLKQILDLQSFIKDIVEDKIENRWT